MRIVSAEGQLSPPLKGVPDVWASGQGGLLDVITDRDLRRTARSSSATAERTSGGGRTAVARAKLNDGSGRLDETKVIFRQEGPLSSGNHHGCRIAQAHDGNLFVTLGDHFSCPRRGAESRQSSRQGDPHRARRLGAAGQSLCRPRRRQAGDLELLVIATSRALRSIRRPASSGKSSTARAAATRSTSSPRARIMAGR